MKKQLINKSLKLEKKFKGLYIELYTRNDYYIQIS